MFFFFNKNQYTSLKSKNDASITKITMFSILKYLRQYTKLKLVVYNYAHLLYCKSQEGYCLCWRKM